MTTYNTGNPVPSADARDRYDNSQTFDDVINGTLTYYANRIGNNILSLKGMADLFNAAQLERDAAFQQFIEGTGWSSLGAYGAGVVITSHTQTVDYLGQPYSLKPSIPASLDAPYVTTGNWATEGANFKLVGDNSLRHDLAELSGAYEVGWEYSPLTQAIRTVGEKLSGLEVDLDDFDYLAVGYTLGGDKSTWDWGPSFTAADARLNSVSSNGGTIRVKQGTYGLGSNANLVGLGKNLIGAGVRATEFRALPGYTGDMITFTNSSYCIARGFKVVGRGGTTQRGVYMPYRPDAGVTLQNKIESVQVENVAEGIALENPIHCSLRDVRTDRACTLFGLRSQFKAGLGAGQGGTNLSVQDCWFQAHETTGTCVYVNSNTGFSCSGTTQFEHGRNGLVLRACPGAFIPAALFEDCGLHISLQGCSNPTLIGPTLDSGTTPDLGGSVQPMIDIDGGFGIKIFGLYSIADDKTYIDALIRFSNNAYGVYPDDVLIDGYKSLGNKGLLGEANVTQLRIVKDGILTLRGFNVRADSIELPIRTAPPTTPRLGVSYNADGVLWKPVGSVRARVIYSGGGVYTLDKAW